jgi:hypothetical protein
MPAPSAQKSVNYRRFFKELQGIFSADTGERRAEDSAVSETTGDEREHR